MKARVCIRDTSSLRAIRKEGNMYVAHLNSARVWQVPVESVLLSGLPFVYLMLFWIVPENEGEEANVCRNLFRFAPRQSCLTRKSKLITNIDCLARVPGCKLFKRYSQANRSYNEDALIPSAHLEGDGGDGIYQGR